MPRRAPQAQRPHRENDSEATDVDVVVIGSGAGGLATAVTAAHQGLRVVVLERERYLGGATSRSGGWMWAPRTHFARGAGVNESLADVKEYLKAATGPEYDEAKVDAFLSAAPDMVRFFHESTSLRLVPGATIQDIYGSLPHAGTGHRSVAPAPLDGRMVPKPLRRILAPQYWETSFLGMGIMAGADLQGFLAAAQFRLSGWVHAAKRVTGYVWDLITTGSGQHWVNGVALTGRLALSAHQAGVRLHPLHEVSELTTDGATGRVTGVVARTPEGTQRYTARLGVVVATGGFSANAAMRRAFFEHNAVPEDHFTLAPPTADGAGIALGESVGGVLDTSGVSAAAWCPVSLVPYRTGRTGVFPHIMDRAKPGSIGVTRDGRRFVNEANGYWDYVAGMNAAASMGERAEAWQISDSRAAQRYPLGFAMPRPVPKFPFLKSGYLVKAPTVRELAIKCGIDPDELERTIERFNREARAGIDSDFGRGETAFNRYGGDPRVTPNPTLAPLTQAPFYAVRVRQGSFGSFAGLRTDEKSRLLGRDDQPIPGIYVVGADQKNLFGGHYPAGGINLGPAMTFGYLAALDMAREGTPSARIGEPTNTGTRP